MAIEIFGENSPYYTNKIANSGDMDYRTYMERQSRYIGNAIQQSTKQQLIGNAAIAGKLAGQIDDSMMRMQTGIQTAINNQTSAIVASNEALGQTFQHGFNEINNTLDIGFSGVSNQLGSMSAAFSCGLDRVSDNIKGMSKEICDRLDAINDIVNNPLLTQSRELFRRAAANYGKSFFEEALEDINSAVEKYKTDYISWFLKGKILAFGAGEFSNVINLEEAINAFTQAAKYNSPNITESTDARLLSAEVYFYLGTAQYSQSNELIRTNKKVEAREMLDKALKSFEQSFNYSDKMHESLFNSARCKVLQGQKMAAIDDLEKLVLLDRNYCIKVFNDDDFSNISEEIYALINKLKHKLFIDEAETNYKKIIHYKTLYKSENIFYKTNIPSSFSEKLPYFDMLDYNLIFIEIIEMIENTDYFQLILEKNNAKKASDYYILAEKFRKIQGYSNSDKFVIECVKQFNELSELENKKN
ncbi:MAG: hypothetical protein FWD26_05685 [Treponema sp.]|nr:hypothetical protein [Treponema sp.]